MTPYDENYIEQMFYFWYNNERQPAVKLVKMPECPKDIHGRIPSPPVLSQWVNERAWRERGDVLDARVATQIDDELVALKVNMLRKQAAQAAEIRQKSFDHILENGFDSSASAVSAFIKASELERLSLGVSRTIQQLAEMDDEEVERTVRELSERAGADVIDVADTPEDAEPFDT